MSNALARRFARRLSAYQPGAFMAALSKRLDKRLDDVLDGIFDIATGNEKIPVAYRLRAAEIILELTGNPTLIREAAKKAAKGNEEPEGDEEEDEEQPVMSHFRDVRKRKKSGAA